MSARIFTFCQREPNESNLHTVTKLHKFKLVQMANVIFTNANIRKVQIMYTWNV